VKSFCARRVAEELEAYELQNRYLAQVNASRRAVVMGPAPRCDDDGESGRNTPPSMKGD
jgi:hypothetical protein